MKPIAAKLQNTHTQNNPDVVEHYGSIIPPTRTGLDWLNKFNWQDTIKGGGFNTKIGFYGQTSNEQKRIMDFLSQLNPEQLKEYSKVNFNDGEAYFRMPLYEERHYNLDNQEDLIKYNKFLDDKEKSPLKTGVYSKVTNDLNIYTKPLTYQTREFKSTEDPEYIEWLRSNPENRSYNNKVYQKTGNFNYTTPIFNASPKKQDPSELSPLGPIETTLTPNDAVNELNPRVEYDNEIKVEEPDIYRDLDYTPIQRANLFGMFSNLISNIPEKTFLSQFKRPVNHITRPVDQPAVSNSFYNNYYSNNAFQIANRNLPSSVQQAFLNDTTGKIYSKTPLADITNYYNNFSNQQIQQHNNYLNRDYNAERFIFEDNRKQLDNIRQGYEKSRLNNFKTLENYLKQEALIRTSLPWMFMQNGLDFNRVGRYKYRVTPHTRNADLQLAIAEVSKYLPQIEESSVSKKKRRNKMTNK